MGLIALLGIIFVTVLFVGYIRAHPKPADELLQQYSDEVVKAVVEEVKADVEEVVEEAKQVVKRVRKKKSDTTK